MLRLVLPLIVGVVVAAFFPEWVSFDHKILFPTVCAILVGLTLLHFLTRSTRRQELVGFIVLPLMTLMGVTLEVAYSQHLFPDHLISETDGIFLARITEQPRVGENSVRIEAELVNSNVERRGMALLYFEIDSLSERLEYDDLLLLKTDLNEVQPLGNPNEFNYTRYLRFHNILHRGRVDSGKWQIIEKPKFSVLRMFHRLRAKMIERLEMAGLSGSELSVASALILGYRVDVDRDLMTAYAGAGATHVLAVSGLHVGIVYLIFQWMLSFMNRSKQLSLLKLILLISFLVLYAALTGFSPSVNRATFMFVFVAIGKYIDRKTNIYNTLAVSAFVLILINPMTVMDVGFQLSYLAVFGIVLIHPKLFGFWVIENRFGDWIWNITCVSLSAQIATFPLGLLYFHQFPLLFMVSNLLVIPAAGFILYIGFALFAFSWCKPLLLGLGFVLESIIWALNRSVVVINDIPNAVYSGIDISILESIVIYLIIGSILIVVYNKKVWAVMATLFLLTVLAISQTIEMEEQRTQRSITVYNIKGETAIGLLEGRSVTFIGSQKLWENENAMLFHVKHHWWSKGIQHEQFVQLSDSLFNRELVWGHQRIAILNLEGKDQTDVSFTDSFSLVVVNKVDWSQIDKLSSIDARKVIVSNTIGPKTKERLKGVPNVNSVFVSEMGAVSTE